MMRRLSVPSTLLLVAILLGMVAIVPAATGMAPGAVETVSTENGTVGQLSLPAEQTIEQQSVDADLASALGTERARLESTLAASAFEQEFEAAPDRTAKISTVRSAIGSLETKGEVLREERTAAVRAFNHGELTGGELFRSFALIKTRADGIQERLATIEAVTQQSEFSMPSYLSIRLSSLEADLVSLRGPVLERITAAARAEHSPIRIGVTTADSGMVLGTIEGETFYREGALWTARAETGPNQFASDASSPLLATHEHAQAVYPWAFEHLVSNPSISGFGDSTIYPVRLNHAHGEVIAYFDGRTTDVFFERQRLRLSQLPNSTVATNQTDSLSIRVNETGEGRPLAVTVTDPVTQSGTNAQITVGNETVGQTGDAGQLWILDVADGQRITATADGESVSVTIGG